MFRHRGRVRVALSKQDVASGWVDKLLDEVLPAGAEDFDQVTGAGEDVEVEVRYTVIRVILRPTNLMHR
jgi:transcriptional/translational regulatory protein YebC/TACO1